jgi:hypothetical protein
MNDSIWIDCKVMLPGKASYPIWAWCEDLEPQILHEICPLERGFTHWTPVAPPPPRPFTEAEKQEARHETHAKAEARVRDSIDAHLMAQEKYLNRCDLAGF